MNRQIGWKRKKRKETKQKKNIIKVKPTNGMTLREKEN